MDGLPLEHPINITVHIKLSSSYCPLIDVINFYHSSFDYKSVDVEGFFLFEKPYFYHMEFNIC